MSISAPRVGLARARLLLCVISVSLLIADVGANAVNYKALDGAQMQARALVDDGLRSQPSSAQTLKKDEPLANDTIPISYWATVDAAITAAELTTPSPVMAAPTTKEPWEAVFTASGHYTASGTPAISADSLTPGEIAKLPDEIVYTVGGRPATAEAALDKMSMDTVVVPYDMQLGARLMHSLSDHGTSTQPPTQQVVSEQLVAQCPLVMFTSHIGISAPRCGDSLGEWFDLGTKRNVLRWSPNNDGGVRFGVDSVVSGKGGVTYASFDQEFTLKGNQFKLLNCLKFMRWTVEEEVVKVHSTGQGVRSSIQEHDVFKNTVGFFYRYTIRAANGNAVAQTDLYRKDYKKINVTMIGNDDLAGPLLATATKIGNWNQDAWRECSGQKRMWQLEFALSHSDLDITTVATVTDLRVAVTAMITLMAFRDEAMSDVDGLNHTHESGIVKQLMVAAVIVILAVVLCCGFTVIAKAKRWDARMRRHCFKLEAICLPKRPAWQRKPAFGTTP